MIKIDKEIPVTKESHSTKYPFSKMEIGDSFAVPMELRKIKPRVVQAAWYYGKRHNKKFISRQNIENEIKVIRIWRIE